MRGISVLIFAVTIAFLCGAPAYSQLSYSLTDLGAGTNSYGLGINNSGQVTGSVSAGTYSHAFIWSAGIMTDIATPGTPLIGLGGSQSNLGSAGITWSQGVSINDSGSVAGNFGLSWGGSNAFIYSNGVMTFIPGSYNPGSSAAHGINGTGDVVGEGTDNNGNRTTFIYGGGAINSFPLSEGHAINDAGQIAGSVRVYDNNPSDSKFLYNEAYRATPTGGGAYSFDFVAPNSRAYGINRKGAVVGVVANRAFLLNSGTVLDLGGTATNSVAYAVNTSGQVVGQADGQPFIYSNGLLRSLNGLLNSTSTGWSLSDARGINDAGQIVGSAANGQGEVHAVILTPTLTVRQTTRQPTLPLIFHHAPAGTELRVFSNGRFVLGGAIDTSKPTIVLTHGWNPSLVVDDPFDSVNGWIGQISPLLAQHSAANILAWDWRNEADTSNLGTAAGRVVGEGDGLGLALARALGSDYTKSVHFLGHSLGTLVNAEAINVLHKHTPQAVIQDTLFDEAEAGNLFVNSSMSLGSRYASPLPTAGTVKWIDNYISTFGLPLTTATNVILQRHFTGMPGHGYPPTWFADTVSDPGGSIMGYRWAIENGGLDTPDYQSLADYYKQANAAAPELELTPISEAEATTIIVNRNNSASNTALIWKIMRLENVQSVFDAAGDVRTGTELINSGGTSTLSPTFRLTKSLLVQALAGAIRIDSAATPSGPSASAWLSVDVPQDANSMTFDFSFDGLSSGDYLAFGIDNQLLFQMDSQFVTDHHIYNSGTFDVSQWGGQSVELFIGLIAVDDQNLGGAITVSRIEFGTVPEPSWLSALMAAMIFGHRSRRQSSVVT